MNSMTISSEYASPFHNSEDEDLRQINFLNQSNETNLSEFFPLYNINQKNIPLFYESLSTLTDFKKDMIGGFPISKGYDVSNANKFNKKRGRQNNKIKPQHTEYKNDCRMAKIQVSYISFLIKFINYIMERMRLSYFFIDLNGKYKSNINQTFRNSLNKKTIKEILFEAPISGRFTREQDYNIQVYNRLEKEGYNLIIKILNKNFLFFFEKIYYDNQKKLDLSSFGFDPYEIELPDDIKVFEDLLNKRKKEDFTNYKNQMKKCAEKYFIKSSKLLEGNSN